LTLSVEMFQDPKHRTRGLAEIDGIVAGLKYLDKMEKHAALSAGSRAFDDQTEMLRGLPAETTREVAKLLGRLRLLKRGVGAEFQRFNDMTSGSVSPAIRHLRTQFSSSKALTYGGIFVYRDVFDGLLPETLADIFALFCLFHTISPISMHRKRMEEAQVLSGVQRWRDCIQDVDERGAFDCLALRMRPSSIASSQ
jgi:hypothetical protein